MKHRIWIAIFVYAILFLGNSDLQPWGVPLAWWVIAVGAGCLWTKGLPGLGDNIAKVVDQAFCSKVDAYTVLNGWARTITLRRTGPASYGGG